jgi:hypothetical protein
MMALLAIPLLLVPEAPPSAGEVPAGMISFELRLVDCEAIGWREQFQTRLRFGGHRAGCSAWVADESTMAELLHRFTTSGDSKLLTAPKVTAHAGSPAEIGTSTTRHFVVHAEPVEGDAQGVSSPMPRPVVAPVDDGSRIQLVGEPGAEGMRVKLDIKDSRISRVHVIESEAVEPGSRVKFQVPEVTFRELGGSWVVPEDHALILSLGVDSSTDDHGTSSVRERLLILSTKVIGPSPALPEVDSRLTKASRVQQPVQILPPPTDELPVPGGLIGPSTPRAMRTGSVPTALAATPWGLLPILPLEFDANTVEPGSPLIARSPRVAPAPIPAPAMPLPTLPSRNLPPAIDTDGQAVDPRTDTDLAAEKTDYAPFVDGKPVASPQVTVPVPHDSAEASRPEHVVATGSSPIGSTTDPIKSDSKMIRVRFSLGLTRGLSVDVDLGAAPETDAPAAGQKSELKQAEGTKDSTVQK